VSLLKTATTAGPLFMTHSPVKLFCIRKKHRQQSATQMSGSFERKILQKIFGTVEVNGSRRTQQSYVFAILRTLHSREVN